MPTEAEIYAAMTAIFRDVFLRDDLVLRSDLSAKDVPGWDSFKQIEILMAAEEQYRMRFSSRDLDSLRNVGDLIRAIAAKA